MWNETCLILILMVQHFYPLKLAEIVVKCEIGTRSAPPPALMNSGHISQLKVVLALYGFEQLNWFSGYRNRKTVRNALRKLYITQHCWLRDAMLNTNGCIWLLEVPGTQQLSPLQVGEDNTELQQKIQEKFNFINVVKLKNVEWVKACWVKIWC